MEPNELNASAAALGATLQARAADLATAWRRRRCGRDAERACIEPSALDGLVEPLLFEMGRELTASEPSPFGPWARARGVLRLDPSRGPTALDVEMALLGEVVASFAAAQGAPAPLRTQLADQLHASRTQAQAESARRRDPAAPAPEIRFGGVVVEHFEPARDPGPLSGDRRPRSPACHPGAAS